MLPAEVTAQQKRIVTVEKADSTPFFRGVAIGSNILGPTLCYVSKYGEFEGFVRLNIKDKFFPILEAGIGRGSKTSETTGTKFFSSAPFFRVGMDYNMLKDKHDKYRVFIGGRIGYSSFKYSFAGNDVSDPVWETNSIYSAIDVENSLLWGEVVGGLEAKIWGPIHLGWSVRYKSKIIKKYGEHGEAWYSPGFGRSGNTLIGATFNVIVDF